MRNNIVLLLCLLVIGTTVTLQYIPSKAEKACTITPINTVFKVPPKVHVFAPGDTNQIIFYGDTNVIIGYIGYSAGSLNTTGQQNIAIGYKAIPIK